MQGCGARARSTTAIMRADAVEGSLRHTAVEPRAPHPAESSKLRILDENVPGCSGLHPKTTPRHSSSSKPCALSPLLLPLLFPLLLPFGRPRSAPQNRESLMKELADAGAEAGGLDGLYGDGVALPDFFKTGGGVGDPLEATPAGGGDGGGFDPLEDFGIGGGGRADGDSATALLASLGLPAAGAGAGALDGGGSADQSEWALMQKQFEDMNKSFLQE